MAAIDDIGRRWLARHGITAMAGASRTLTAFEPVTY